MDVLHFLPEIYLLKKLECLSYKSRVCILLITFLKYLLIISSFFFRYRSLSSRFWADLLKQVLLSSSLCHKTYNMIMTPYNFTSHLFILNIWFNQCFLEIAGWYFPIILIICMHIYGGCVCVYKPLISYDNYIKSILIHYLVATSQYTLLRMNVYLSLTRFQNSKLVPKHLPWISVNYLIMSVDTQI